MNKKVWNENLDYQTEFRPHNYAISTLLVHNNVLQTGERDEHRLQIRWWVIFGCLRRIVNFQPQLLKS
jgi:hypothetical protein